MDKTTETTTRVVQMEPLKIEPGFVEAIQVCGSFDELRRRQTLSATPNEVPMKLLAQADS